jgi:ankyrin repeat protein
MRSALSRIGLSLGTVGAAVGAASARGVSGISSVSSDPPPYTSNEKALFDICWSPTEDVDRVRELLAVSNLSALPPVSSPHHGRLLLSYASIRGHKSIVEVLLAAGAVVDASDDAGNTALMDAAVAGRNRVVELLLKAGADVNAANNKGITALINACLSGNAGVVETLLEAGADVYVFDAQHRMPLTIAQGFHDGRDKNSAIVALVLAKSAKAKAAERARRAAATSPPPLA